MGESSGKGTIILLLYQTWPAGQSSINKTPYIIGIILLEEGVRLMSNIVDCNHSSVDIEKSKSSILKT